MTYDEALAYLDDHATYEKTGRIESPSTSSTPGIPARRSSRKVCVANSRPDSSGNS